MSDRAPLLSVVMCVQNGFPYVQLAVESVLNQTFSEFEFVIVDDHSTDGTLEYLQRLTDPRCRVFKSSANGQTPGLNQGLREARGEWIVRMDGDDWCYPSRLAEIAQLARNSNTTALITSDYELCDEALQPIADMHLRGKSPSVIRYLRTKNNPFCHPTVAFRRSTAASVGFFDESLRNAQDYGLWLKLLERGDWEHLSKTLLRYRVRRGSLSILRQPEQSQERLNLTKQSRSSAPPTLGAFSNPRDVQGMYAYRLAFGAWIAGNRGACVRYAISAISHRVRTIRAFMLLATIWLPRRFYLSLTGYDKIYA